MQVSIGNSSENEGWDVPFPSSMTVSVQFFFILAGDGAGSGAETRGQGKHHGHFDGQQ